MLAAKRTLMMVVVSSAFALLPIQLHAAPQEIHGTSDAFAGNGVAVAWGVLRGASDATTMIVLRVSADPARFTAMAADGVDPFTKARQPIVAKRPLTGTSELRIARTQFADFPRTELSFFDPSAPAPPPALIVYYLGVPDTTPEFASEAALAAYLIDRIAKLREGGSKK